MFSLRVHARFPRIFRQNSRLFVSSAQPASDEYVSEAQYPEILDPSYRAKILRKKLAWHEKLKKVATVEEKLLGINMPRYFGYKCVMLNDEKFPYNCLGFNQFATRTVFHETDKLPDFYRQYDEAVERITNAVKGAIEEALVHELTGYRKAHEGAGKRIDGQEEIDLVAAAIVRELNRILINSLCEEFPHLEAIDVDLQPRHEAFWAVGGIQPPKRIEKMLEKSSWAKEYKDDPVDRFFQYRGTPYVAVRHEFPLEPLTNVLEAAQGRQDLKVPEFLYDPHTLGYSTDHCHGTSIPGFWPGERREFGTISFQRRSFLFTRNKKFGAEDEQEALHANGIISSYSWLLGQAAMQGFNTYNELTYPLVGQTVLTDGQRWSFYAYQLNTLLLHSNYSLENPRANECWGTREEKLFEGVDEAGKLVGFNQEVLKRLIAFYCNTPRERQHEMKPYVKSTEKHLAEIADPQKRKWLEETFKHIMSNRPRHWQIPEIQHWEKIYQIDHDKRPMDARRKFFQLGENPYNRRLDNHPPKYIPKSIRPGGPKSKDKFEKQYYPDC
ncbi:39S ribosomal protein S30, mitochondrial [Lutzomyia longipalpis]|uniref:39S ribosomal protein S30, mitochondrial n=1 Tax=Lutzomyia longipalpis TaxID=7200 RepID=UPI002483F788|nr:39S ribosomal protein S30, mitochondrial [Lutzomyia longipalpis]